MPNPKTTRRTFLKQSAMGAAALPILSRRVGAAPSSRIQHAAIGVMGQGRSDLGEINASGKVDVVALCDIDSRSLAQAAKSYPDARLYRDWREMLEQEEDNIDSVNIATPDHMHAPAAMTAIRKGKHVYCEKPLTHEVYEARQLALAARKRGVATQMGIQIHAHDFYRTAVHWIKEGAIGKIKEFHSFSSASFSVAGGMRPMGADPIPAEVEWDLWLGVAPERSYKEKVYHPFEWRRWKDFGCGATGDFGCHIFDPIFTALDLNTPLSITAESENVNAEGWPAWVVLHYEFVGTELTAGRTIKATWNDGGKKPAKELSPHLPADYELPASGSMIIGEEGTLILPHIARPELHPIASFKDYPMPDLEPRNHYHEFVDAAMGNTIAGANFDFAGPLTETILLGNIANRFPGERLEWNADRLKFKGHRDANDCVRRKYRKGWKVRGL